MQYFDNFLLKYSNVMKIFTVNYRDMIINYNLIKLYFIFYMTLKLNFREIKEK